MWTSAAQSFEELRGSLDTLPVIETHEHWCGVCPRDTQLDLLAMLAGSGYYASDLHSASGDYAQRPSCGMFPASPLADYLSDTRNAFDARYAAWRTYHDRTRHTAYSRALFEGLRVCWGVESVEKGDLLAAQERLRAERDQAFADGMLAQHGIQGMIVDTDLTAVMDGRLPYREGFARFVIDLPQYHALFSEAAVRKPHLELSLGRKIVTLDDYLEAFERFVLQAKAFGVVGFKDQTAYRRDLEYGNPGRAQAEELFNRMVARPRDVFGTAEVRPLDDFLFNQFLRLAARHALPVQLHTGHMAGIRNEIQKTNPAHLTTMLELHADVEFDLFHGGWPFMGEYLFLGKNYPNVNLDLCWANVIDPPYCVELLTRAVMTVPHSKLSGFGGDTHLLEMQVGSLILARDNIAAALADLVDTGWLGMGDALAVAHAWLFDNPNRLFGLGLTAPSGRE
jgi:hypothetical protein